jgi:hypothetical protein
VKVVCQAIPSSVLPNLAPHLLKHKCIRGGIAPSRAAIAADNDAPETITFSETTKAQISAVSTALELYELDNDGFPSEQLGLRGLLAAPDGGARWKGPYTKRPSGIVDPWGLLIGIAE